MTLALTALTLLGGIGLSLHLMLRSFGRALERAMCEALTLEVDDVP